MRNVVAFGVCTLLACMVVNVHCQADFIKNVFQCSQESGMKMDEIKAAFMKMDVDKMPKVVTCVLTKLKVMDNGKISLSKVISLSKDKLGKKYTSATETSVTDCVNNANKKTSVDEESTTFVKCIIPIINGDK